MNLYKNTYINIINLARSKNATKFLYGLSFIESFFFPIPPDLILAPVVLTRKYKWYFLAFYTTLYSVLGGLVGYIIGFYLYDIILSTNFFNENALLEIKSLFNKYDYIIIIIAGFTPLPYKAFTITAGYMSIAIFPFIVASFIGRGLRFFLVAAIFNYFDKLFANKLKKYFEYIGIIIILLIIFFLFSKYL